MPGPLSPSAQKIQNLLNDLGHPIHVLEHAVSTRTCAEAAAVVGCDVAQIAKSMIFRTKEKSLPVLVVASGANRVSETRIARRLADRIDGDRLVRAEPDFVRASTGFAIGGVPPIGHAVAPVTLFDRDLLGFEVVWAAAGTPNSVFPIAPRLLLELTGGTVDEVV
ncbi:MAG TPA: YbaK/EbsC family protein [Azospirillaceae bacterium]|nr:YbaK/EbsC family protein [Azospirillaceae bacterium]